MSQWEKLIARLKSLDDGFATVQIYLKNGEPFCWAVDTKKVEGIIQERKGSES